jgi:hypothetical protein
MLTPAWRCMFCWRRLYRFAPPDADAAQAAIEKLLLQLGLFISRQNQHFLELGHCSGKKRVQRGALER